MPKPLPTVISKEKTELVRIFSSYLLSSSHGYTNASIISKQLIKDIIIHKSFGAAFSRFEGVRVSSLTSAIEYLTDDIHYYFARPAINSASDYDAWEKATGEKFIVSCNTCSGKTFHFGKAQKIINVTMKHLFCYSVNEDYFKYCHVALDSMTYTGRSTNSLDGGFYKNEVNPNAVTISFSNLDYSQYIDIQNKMRDYLASQGSPYKDSATGINLTPFQSEFYIWPRYKK